MQRLFRVTLIPFIFITETAGFIVPSVDSSALQRAANNDVRTRSLLGVRTRTSGSFPVGSKRRTTSAMAVQESDVVSKSSATGKGLQLNFLATNEYETKPVGVNPKRALKDFFLDRDNRNLLLGGCEKVEVVSSEQETDAVQREVLSIVKGGLTFPGIAIKSFLQMEVLLEDDADTALPQITYTLLSSEQRADGAAPVVWLYNRLTGANTQGDGGSSSSTGSVTVISAAYAPGAGGEEIVFRADARLQIGFSIPASVFRLLPITPAKFEESGSKSIQKVLDRDLVPSVENFRGAYVKWSS